MGQNWIIGLNLKLQKRIENDFLGSSFFSINKGWQERRAIIPLIMRKRKLIVLHGCPIVNYYIQAPLCNVYITGAGG